MSLLRLEGVTKRFAADAPPAAMQVVALGADGTVATSLFANNAWSPIAPLAGAKDVEAAIFVNNPQRASRTLLLRARDGVLSSSSATGDQPFGNLGGLEIKAQFSPVAVVDGSDRLSACSAAAWPGIRARRSRPSAASFRPAPS